MSHMEIETASVSVVFEKVNEPKLLCEQEAAESHDLCGERALIVQFVKSESLFY